jgi:hypothetical protein
MLETRSKSIDGFEYRVTQLGAKQGRVVFTRLAKVLGQAMADKDNPIAALASSLDPGDVDYLCDTFAPVTTVNIQGKEPRLSDIFDMHFAGKYGPLLKWLGFCMEVNFGSFLDEMGINIAGQSLAEKVASHLNPPKAPIGTSSVSASADGTLTQI